MNKNILVCLGVVALVFLFLNLRMTGSGGIVSSYIPTKVKNATNLGFVKPEHKLLKVFSSISSGSKVKLSGTCTEFIYNKNTIEKTVNDRLVRVITTLIDTLQQVTSQEYYMKRIENVYAQVDRKGNQRYIVDFFVYDVKNYYTIRLIGDIVVIDGELFVNYLNVQSGSSPTLLNNYDVKFNTMGILFDANMFHENIANLFDNYYMNSFKLIGISDQGAYNSEDLNDVLSLNSLRNMYFPANTSDLTVHDYESKGLSGKLEEYVPSDQHTIKSPTFCKKSSLSWDSNGVPLQENDNAQSCYENNNSSIAIMNDPWFHPRVMYERSSNDAYQWLKDPARGNIIRASGYRQ